MLNAAWLQTFVTVCEDGNLTRTAERLHMTQPGVSQHLKKLERQVGTALQLRHGKDVTLTPAGERVRDLGLSRRIEEHRALHEIHDDDPDVGTVSIACSGSFAALLYPKLLSLAKPRPDLVLQLEAAPQTRVLNGVSEGQFDIGVLHNAPGHPRLEALHLGREEICLVLSADWDGGVPTLEDLDRLGFIAHRDGASFADLLLGPNFPEDFTGGDRLKMRSQVNQLSQILLPVSAGIGYSILPRSGVEVFADQKSLQTVALPVPIYQDLWLIKRKHRQLARRAEAPISLITELGLALTPRS